MTGFATIISLFIIIGLGYLGKRTVLADQSTAALNLFVYYFAVPVLLFNAIYKQPLADIFQPLYLAGFTLAVLLTGLVCMLSTSLFFKEKNGEILSILGLNSTFSNYAYMGIPVIGELFGQSGYNAMISIIILGNVFQIPTAQLLIESQRSQGKGIKPLLQVIDSSILRNPIVLASVLGIIFSGLAIKIPNVLETSFNLMAPATVPVALFCLGTGLEFKALNHCKFRVLWIILIKLVIHPLLTLIILSTMGINGQNLKIAVLLAALPSGALTHVIALRYQVATKETSLGIVLSTLISLISVSLWLDYLQT